MACCLLGAMVLAQWLSLWELARNRIGRAWAFLLRRPLPPRATLSTGGGGWRSWRRLLFWELVALGAAAAIAVLDDPTISPPGVLEHARHFTFAPGMDDLCSAIDSSSGKVAPMTSFTAHDDRAVPPAL